MVLLWDVEVKWRVVQEKRLSAIVKSFISFFIFSQANSSGGMCSILKNL
jgi:hypothetical protein